MTQGVTRVGRGVGHGSTLDGVPGRASARQEVDDIPRPSELSRESTRPETRCSDSTCLRDGRRAAVAGDGLVRKLPSCAARGHGVTGGIVGTA